MTIKLEKISTFRQKVSTLCKFLIHASYFYHYDKNPLRFCIRFIAVLKRCQMIHMTWEQHFAAVLRESIAQRIGQPPITASQMIISVRASYHNSGRGNTED